MGATQIHRKTSAAGVGGAAGIVAVFVLAQFGVHAGPEVAAAIATLAAFAASFVKSA